MRYRRNFGGLDQELAGLEQVLDGPTFPFLYLEETFAAPAKLAAGMVIFADGTTWDPGAGRGVYWYDGSTWNLLG